MVSCAVTITNPMPVTILAAIRPRPGGSDVLPVFGMLGSRRSYECWPVCGLQPLAGYWPHVTWRERPACVRPLGLVATAKAGRTPAITASTSRRDQLGSSVTHSRRRRSGCVLLHELARPIHRPQATTISLRMEHELHVGLGRVGDSLDETRDPRACRDCRSRTRESNRTPRARSAA